MMNNTNRKKDNAGLEAGNPGSLTGSQQGKILRKTGKSIIKIGMWLLVVLVLLVLGITMLNSLSIRKLQSTTQSLDQLDKWFQYIRWGFIAALITWWKPINTRIAKYKKWNSGQLRIILEIRWFALGMLVFVELIFIQRIYEQFIG